MRTRTLDKILTVFVVGVALCATAACSNKSKKKSTTPQP
jgi:hypothetical protein